jgi:hypothetical protein
MHKSWGHDILVARFMESGEYFNESLVSEDMPAQIGLNNVGVEMQDLVVISWFYKEKRKREKDVLAVLQGYTYD